MNRRNMLRFLGAGTAMVAGVGAVSWLNGNGTLSMGRRGGGRLIAQTRLGLGTFVSMSVVDTSAVRAEEAIGTAFATLDRLDNELTRYRSDSALSVLNIEGHLEWPPPGLLRLLELAAYSHRITNGAFDPTVQPVLAYLEQMRDAERQPDPLLMADLRPMLGFEHVRWNSREICLKRKGMALTLNAVGKGYIVDQLSETLRNYGVRHGLVNAGGDLRVFGGKDNELPWTIALRDPFNPGKTLTELKLFDGACATTGDYEVFFDKDRQFHHVVDPTTAMCPHWAHSVTVLADSTALADSLSTALMVRGPAGRDMVSRHGQIISLI